MDYKITDVPHGGPDYADLEKKGILDKNLLDFSVSINPFPLPRPVRLAIKYSRVSAYPDPEALRLRAAISTHRGRHRDEIIPVSGLSQGIFLLNTLLSSNRRGTVIAGPTYGEYEKYSRIAGSEVTEFRSLEKDNFYPDTDKLCSMIRDKKPAVTWLCNPNNPTSSILESVELREIALACKAVDGHLIIDEAYINFTGQADKSSVSAGNIITMRSMTKDFSLPGLRLGYIMADRKITAGLKSLQPVWSVSSPAQAAGVASLSSLEAYEKQWDKIRKSRAEFIRMLENFSLKIYPGTANFILIKPDKVTEPGWSEGLLNSGILVRDCTSFGLPGFIRLGVLPPPANRKFIKTIRRLGLWEK